MRLIEKRSLLDLYYTNISPDTFFDYKSSGFRAALKKYAFNSKSTRFVFTPEGEIDTHWLSFLQWVYSGNAARINDAIHGYIWFPDDTGKRMNPAENMHDFLIMSDPVARVEQKKVEERVRFINRLFAVTNKLQHITFIGGGNIPERLYGLKLSAITVLDREYKVPIEDLFPKNDIQQRCFHAVRSDGIYPVNFREELMGGQNVVIINRRDIVSDKNKLKQALIQAGVLLDGGGHCFFDLPIFNAQLFNSELYEAIEPFIEQKQPQFVPSDCSAVDRYIHEVVESVNNRTEMNGSHFEIEGIKLIDGGLQQSITAEILLRKHAR